SPSPPTPSPPSSTPNPNSQLPNSNLLLRSSLEFALACRRVSWRSQHRRCELPSEPPKNPSAPILNSIVPEAHHLVFPGVVTRRGIPP
ncbi:MAG: hypothetical protein K2M04_05475, partial [Muribaculaceae bacterium]|nr:hypothetical protein [Muribaculaceae bacterium]